MYDVSWVWALASCIFKTLMRFITGNIVIKLPERAAKAERQYGCAVVEIAVLFVPEHRAKLYAQIIPGI